jgi:hypothetical protein
VTYAAIAAVVTWPLARRLGSAVIGDPSSDMGGTVGWLWTLGQEGGYHVFGTTERVLTGAPLGWTQGNALNLQWLLSYYPAFFASRVWDEVVAYNLTILTGLALSSVAMYALARRLGCSPLVAGWAGLVYLLFPWHIWRVNVGHASLVHLEVLPILVIALDAWVRRPSIRRSALVGLATCACWLASGYWGAMAVVGAVAFALTASAVRARADGFRRAAGGLGVLSLGVLLGTIAIGLLSLPGRADGGIAIPRTVEDLSIYGARLPEFLVPAAGNPILGGATESFRPGQHGSHAAETTLFLGWLTVALAAVWLVFVLLRRHAVDLHRVATTAGLVGALVAGLAFAAPSPIGIGGGRLFTWTPSWFLFQVLPEVRVPSRFLALVSTVVIALAALGLQLARNRLARRSPDTRGEILGIAVVALAVLVSVAELWPDVGAETRADRLPAVYAAVGRGPAGVLAEYPMDEASDYRFWQRLHRRPLLNGAGVGSDAADVARRLVDPSAPGTAAALSLLGVSVIATRADALDFEEGVPDVPDASWGPGYGLLDRFSDGASVWRVTAAPAPAVAALASPGFDDPTRHRDGLVAYPLRNGTGHIVLRAREPGRARMTFDVVAPRGRQVLRVDGAPGSITRTVARRTPVSLVVDVPTGTSVLTVTSDADGIELSAPALTSTADRADLRAGRISPDPGF